MAKQARKVAQEETDNNGWSVKVVERAGVKLQYQLPGSRSLRVVRRNTVSYTLQEERETPGRRGSFIKELASPVRNRALTVK